MADPYAAFSSPAAASNDPYAQIAGPAPMDARAPVTQAPAFGAPPVGMAEGIGQSALQGATLGWGDEIQSLIAAGIARAADVSNRPPPRRYVARKAPPLVPGQPRDFGDYYREAADALRGDMARFASENPKTAIAANIAGGLATGGTVIQGAKLASIPVTGMRGALSIGAGTGAVAGAGVADDMSTTPESAIKGALMGLGVGGTIAGGSHILGQIWKRLAPTAQDRLSKLAAASGLTPTEIETRLYALGPKATLADVSEVFRRAADTAASRLGPTARKVQELARRDETQFGRLMVPIRRLLGGVDDAVDTVGKLKDIRSQQASPLYEAAFAKPVQLTDRLRDLLSRPEAEKAWRRVQGIGKSDPDIDVALMQNGKDPSFRGLQSITEKLRDRATALAQNGQNKDASIVKRLRAAILGEMDAQSPEFAQARALWAGTRQADDMMEEGMSFMKPSMTAADVREAVAAMSEADKAFYRLGIGRAIEERMASTTDTRDLSLLFRNEAFRDKVMAAFPSRESAVDFINTVRAEAIKKATGNSVARNSSTQPRQVAESQLGGMSIDTGATSKHGLIAKVLEGVSAPRERTIQQIGDYLLSQDRSSQAEAIAAMLERGRRPLTLKGGAAAGANLAGQNQ